jgi:hypothetical protein
MPIVQSIEFCVPTYNRAPVVRKTSPINAAICGRYENCYLTYLDNASRDKTSEVLAETLAAYSGKCRVVSNPANIGLKGSLLRIYREFSAVGKLLVFLSDEDVIYEPGLQTLEDELQRNPFFIKSNQHYCFNYLTRRGKDFPYRRRRAAALTWGEFEPFTFGYVTGFGSTLDSAEAEMISESVMLDARNVYPHWASFHFQPSRVAVPGIALVAEFSVGNATSYHEELIYQESHLTPRHVNAYCVYHAAIKKGWQPWLWRQRYRCCNALMRAFASRRYGVALLWSAITLCLLWPRIFLYYVLRAKTW